MPIVSGSGHSRSIGMAANDDTVFVVGSETTNDNRPQLVATRLFAYDFSGSQKFVVSRDSGAFNDVFASPSSVVVVGGNQDGDSLVLVMDTDGVTVGADSTVTNSLFKVNDDVIKLYASGMVVSHDVIWHQPTGAAFQLSWNLSQDVTGVAVSDVDIIASDRDQGPPSETGYNNAVVGCRNLNGATMSQLSFERVRLEASPYQLFGIRIQDTMTGFDSGLGSVESLLFKAWVVAAMPLAVSVFDGNGTQTGEIKTVTFDSVVVDGTAIDGTIESTYLVRQGLTSDFQYP